MRVLLALFYIAESCSEPAPAQTASDRSTERRGPAAVLDAPRLAVSADHACLIRPNDGALFCWGNNTTGQLGVDEAPASGAARIDGIRARDVAVNRTSTCICDAEARTWCWGFDGMPDRSAAERARPRPIDVPPCRAVIAGTFYACSLATDGVVRCWGDIPFPGPEASRPRPHRDYEVPKEIEGLPPITALYGGAQHVCGIGTDDAAYCFTTADRYGETSNGPRRGTVVRVPIPSVRTVAAAYYRTCVVSADGTLYCWGLDRAQCVRANADADCGEAMVDGHAACQQPEPSVIGRGLHASSVTLGFGRDCILAPGGDLTCWPPLPSVNGLSWTGLSAASLSWDGSFSTELPFKNGGCVLTRGDEIQCWTAGDNHSDLDAEARVVFRWAVPYAAVANSAARRQPAVEQTD